MTQSKTQEFFHQKKVKDQDSGIDWNAKRDAWIASIDQFYETITKKYLKASIKAGDIAVSYQTKMIVEEYIGKYEVRELVLTVGSEQVVFSPKGRNIVGAAGRIDLIGERGEATLLVQPGERWCIMASRIPTVKIIELDENSLVEVLRGIMRP
jgi:hypothetical protein